MTTTRLAPWIAACIDGTADYLNLRDRMSLDEAADLFEVRVVRAENERRAAAAAAEKGKQGNG